MTDSKKPLAYDAYQELADLYADKVDTKPHNAYYERPAMLSLLPELQGKRVLDAGCGPGAYAQALATRGANVVGVDMCDRMLARAQERVADEISNGKVELLKVDLSQPMAMFADASFDFVNAPLCLDYIENWRAVFAEFHRLLTPGGQVLFSCGHPAFDAEHFNTRNYFSVEQVKCTWKGFGKRIQMPSFRRSLEEITTPLIEAGFLIERVHEPLPTQEFKSADLRRFRILMHRPCFICIRARKQ